MEPDYANLPDEMKFDLALKLDYKTLIDYCKTSSEFLEGICGNNYFWKRKTYYDFEDLYDIEPTKIVYGIAGLYEDFEGDWWETYQYYRGVFSRNFIEHLQAENVEAILDDVGLIRERKFLIVDEKTQKKGDERRWGVTALMAAVEKGYEDIINFLLEEGADIEAKNNKGQTALMRAVLVENQSIVDLLLSKGANVNVKDNLGITPLMYAVETENKDIVDLLLSKGANVNAQTDSGRTVLMDAATIVGNRDIVDLLLSKGANVNAQTDSGLTALMQAVFAENSGIVDLLLSKGANVNTQNNSGETVLMFASTFLLLEIVRRLLKAGANPNIIDYKGESALDWLGKYGDDPDIERMLQNAMSRQLPVYLF